MCDGCGIRLGMSVGRATPSESAIRRLLQKVDRRRWTPTGLAAGALAARAVPR
jgi:hypothetical protein